MVYKVYFDINIIDDITIIEMKHIIIDGTPKYAILRLYPDEINYYSYYVNINATNEQIYLNPYFSGDFVSKLINVVKNNIRESSLNKLLS